VTQVSGQHGQCILCRAFLLYNVSQRIDGKGVTKAVRHGRFWTKLSDCNGFSFELDSDSLYQDRVKAVRAVMES